MKYHPKKICSMEELKAEPVTYKTLGGLEAMLKLGMQNERTLAISQEIAAINHLKAAKDLEQVKRGVVKAENIAHGKGYISGVKDFMISGDKFVVLVKDKPEPLLFPSLKQAYESKEFSDLFGATLANQKLGKSFAESVYNTDLQKRIEELKLANNYEKNAKIITDQSEGIQVKPQAYFKAVTKLNELKSQIKSEKVLHKEAYHNAWAQIAAGQKDIPYLIKDLELQPTKTALILTDDYHLYNTATMRTMKKEGFTQGVADLRTNAKPIDSEDIKDYIFRPGVPIESSNILAKMEQAATKNRDEVIYFMNRENLESPFIDKSKHSKNQKPLKALKMKPFEEAEEMINLSPGFEYLSGVDFDEIESDSDPFEDAFELKAKNDALAVVVAGAKKESIKTGKKAKQTIAELEDIIFAHETDALQEELLAPDTPPKRRKAAPKVKLPPLEANTNHPEKPPMTPTKPLPKSERGKGSKTSKPSETPRKGSKKPALKKGSKRES